jgi:hypothetical protein
MAYFAIISKLENTRKHPNADRLAISNCLGYQVIVGLDAKDGDVVILFPDDGQLSNEYCYENSLYNKPENNKDQSKTGYFDHKRRVKAQLFRSAKSEAYVASLESLAFTGVDLSTLTIGTKFDSINGVPICNKYYTEATLKASKGVKTQAGYNKERLKKLFPEHIDTEQIRFAQDFELEGLVTLTRKLHGSSARTGHLKFPVAQKYSWWQKVKSFIGNYKLPDEIYEWQIVQGTRRVIKGKVKDSDTDFRSNCSRILAPNIEKGEIFYYEIVGFEETGKSIMNPVATKEMGKDFVKRFGDTITYKYGCLPGTCDIYVYRITHQNDDGVIYELPWYQVKDKCKKAGIKHVPEIGTYVIKEGDISALKETIEYHTEGVDIIEPLDESHIREGVCVRIDNLDSGRMKIFKSKTLYFKILEGIIKNNDVVDIEELESLI